jgi:hypothetical protein
LRVGLVDIGGALALAASLAIGACGGGGDSSDLASLAPPDAPFFAEFVLRPEGDQAEAIESFAERVAGIDDPGSEIATTIDESFADSGLEITYAEDVEPWLGERGSVFVRSFEPSSVAGGVPDFALAVETDDADAARSFVETAVEADPTPHESRSYGGFDYSYSPGDGGLAVGLIAESLVVGTETSFKVAVDASEGMSLAESEEYSQRTEALGDDLLGSAFLEPAAAIEAGLASEGIAPGDARMLEPLLAGPLSEPLAIGLSATTEAASIDFAATVTGEDAAAADRSLIESLPAGSWLAVAVPDLGQALERVLDQLANGGLPGGGSIQDALRARTGIDLRADVVDWLGDAAGFVEGTSAPGFTAGLIAETTDPEGPRKLLETVQALAESDSGLRSAAPPEGADYGFSLGLPGLGGGAEAGVVGDRVVAVIGGTVAEVLEPASALGDDSRYQAAVESLGEDLPPALYVDLPSLLEVAEQAGSASDPEYQAAAPYLGAFASLVGGSRVEDELAVTRLTVSLGQ